MEGATCFGAEALTFDPFWLQRRFDATARDIRDTVSAWHQRVQSLPLSGWGQSQAKPAAKISKAVAELL